MPSPIRPRRSALYMPGANSRALEKARGLDADGLIFDSRMRSPPTPRRRRAPPSSRRYRWAVYGERELLVRVNALGHHVGRG